MQRDLNRYYDFSEGFEDCYLCKGEGRRVVNKFVGRDNVFVEEDCEICEGEGILIAK